MLDFTLPAHLEASEPPEARGLARDEIRLMVSCGTGERVLHRRFRDLPDLLAPGDLVVVNTSATLKASVPAVRMDGSRWRMHLSTELPDGRWVVEVRRPHGPASEAYFEARAGETWILPAGTWLVLQEPHSEDRGNGVRLWRAALHLDRPVPEFLEAFGRPIRYGYVHRDWPVDAYRTEFANEPGSAEMPSAGRPLTRSVLRSLRRRGVTVAPIVLHTGVASQEVGELPYEEAYRVSADTAARVNRTRAAGGRVVAVGTTVVRALESATDETGTVHAADGWTGLVITPERGVRVVDALITGLHEPRSTHLAMLEAVAGRPQVERTYAAALDREYLWHEFGDAHLLFTNCAVDLADPV